MRREGLHIFRLSGALPGCNGRAERRQRSLLLERCEWPRGALRHGAGHGEAGRFYLAASEQPYPGGVTFQPGCEGRCLVFHTGGAFPTGCEHTGFTGTSLWIDREAGLGLALLTNRLCYDHLPRADMNAFRLAVHEAILEERN